MTRVLVTGSTGQVGRTFAAWARGQGHDVVGLARSERPATDLLDADAVVALLDAAEPEVVVHAAAMTDVDRCESEPEMAEALNVEAPRLLAGWCARRGAHLVHISTNYVFGGAAPDPYPTDAPTDPINVYGRTKADGEAAARAAGGDAVTVARTAWVTSTAGPSLVHTVLRRAAAGQPLEFLDDQLGQATVAEDLAPALGHLVATRPGGTWHLTNPDTFTPWSLARTVLTVAGLDPELVTVAGPEHPERARPARRPRNARFDLSSTRAVPELALPPYAEGLDRILPGVRRAKAAQLP